MRSPEPIDQQKANGKPCDSTMRENALAIYLRKSDTIQNGLGRTVRPPGGTR
jgi:hypothetical protein